MYNDVYLQYISYVKYKSIILSIHNLIIIDHTDLAVAAAVEPCFLSKGHGVVRQSTEQT